MASPDLLKALAKMFLEPPYIDETIAILNDRFRLHTDAKEYDRAFVASQLLAATQKVRAKQQAPPKPEKPVAADTQKAKK